MRGARNTFHKRLHSLTISPRKVRELWQPPFWIEKDGFRDIPCRQCRKFDELNQACSVVYGSPSRKCAAAAIEANLNDVNGESVLEIGGGSWALARNLIRRSGGTWTGIDPGQPQGKKARIGHSGYGHAADIPFADETFDLVYGIQTFEHWGQRIGNLLPPSRYEDCLAEILRVLKPGGRVYLDAPMHFHGNEMFIMGDVAKLRSLFGDNDWADVTMQRWRLDYAPLERFLPAQFELDLWPQEVVGYPQEQVQATLENASSWMLAFNARKKPD